MRVFRNTLRCLLGLYTAALLSACGGGGTEDPASLPASASDAGASISPDKRTLADGVPFAGNGWYWNPLEGGTGFMFEAQGKRGFVGFFMYDEDTGNPIWYVAYGDLTAGARAGEFGFSGNLGVYSGGKPVTSDTYTSATPSFASVGTVAITFVGTKANVMFPGGRLMPAERFPIDGSGVDFAKPTSPRSHQPEVGWYWNPAEGGRGYAIEVQNDKVFMAVFHYNLDGSPTWNLVQGDISTGTAAERFQMTSGGQSLTSAYRGGVRDLLGPFTMSFRNACAGQLQLFGAPPITVRRFVIDGTTQPPGSECNALATLADVPGNQTTASEIAPGDSTFGNIDSSGDVDDFRIALVAGTTYTFDLLGLPSRSGTLENPGLGLIGPDLSAITENDDRAVDSTESRIAFTPTTSGTYFLRVRSSTTGVGTYLLTSTGTAPVIKSAPSLPGSGFEGTLSGRLRGRQSGEILLTLSADGRIAGTIRYDSAPAQAIAITGQFAATGVVSLATAGGVSCIGFHSGTNLLAGCGQAGMLAGQAAPTAAGAAPVGGVIAGLARDESISLLVNGGAPLRIIATGAPGGTPFVFPTPLASGEVYRVTVDAASPSAFTFACTVKNGVGVVSAAVDFVGVHCTRRQPFGNGIRLVGIDIVPGLYRSANASSASCYWARLADTTGESGSILANDFGTGSRLVEILASDVAFESSRCAQWTPITNAVTASPGAPFGDGVYLVGLDVLPGLWRSDVSGTGCYWARLRNLTGADDILANDIGAGPRLVEILATDQAFESSRCGQWSRVTGGITATPSAPFTDGVYLVGLDIQPGVWRSNGSGSGCYWARLANLSGTKDIIANHFGSAPTVVTVRASDAALEVSGCGTWTLVQ